MMPQTALSKPLAAINEGNILLPQARDARRDGRLSPAAQWPLARDG